MSSHFRPYSKGQTIAAVATPPGEGGIAVIRISGDQAAEIADKIFSRKVSELPSHTVHYGSILSKEKNRIDTGLIFFMKAPKSYTGEDTVEIHCHGGSLITKKVLEAAFDAGALPANPGEFTFRAFLNQKIDLAQAEAVQELISARNELALHSADLQLKGVLSKRIENFQTRLIDVAAILEAWVDFPEEGLEFASMEEVCLLLNNIAQEIAALANTFETGKMIHQGLKMCLVGLPNVGKSSLMNALLKKERAIVTAIPGTTRDLIEDDLKIGSLHFKILDTAGIRETDEIIEKEGIRRSYEAIQAADVVLFVLDLTRELEQEEKELIANLNKQKTLLVWNKRDLKQKASSNVDGFFSVEISAKDHLGIEELVEKINELIWKMGPPSKEEVLITNLRHKVALQNAEAALKKIAYGLEEGISAEFLAIDMRFALKELSSIIGFDLTEDVLSAIFSKFCVGK